MDLFDLSGLSEARQPSVLSKRIQLAIKNLNLTLKLLELSLARMVLHRDRRMQLPKSGFGPWH
jgi:hypothetical protein